MKPNVIFTDSAKLKLKKLCGTSIKKKDKIRILVMGPALVLGPVINKKFNTSSLLIVDALSGKSAGVMDLLTGYSDIRDEAEAHFQAMFREEVNGRRYINIIYYLCNEYPLRRGCKNCERRVWEKSISYFR